MDIFTILTGILESLNIGDIATTEYVISKGGKEANPLFKNQKMRRLSYIPKLAMPVVFKALSLYDNPLTRLGVLIGELLVTGIYSVGLGSNVIASIKAYKETKKRK